MGFLSSCDRDLRNLSSCLREVKSPFKLRGVRGIALESLQENRALSCIWRENSWCFLRCSRKLWAPLELRRGPQGASHVASGKSGLLSSCEGFLRMPLELLQQNTASSRVKVCNSGLLSNCHRYLRVPIVFQQVSQPSSHFEAYNSSFLWSCKRSVRSPVEFRGGIWAFSTCATGESDLLHVVRGYSGFHSISSGESGLVLSLWGYSVSFLLVPGTVGFLSSFSW